MRTFYYYYNFKSLSINIKKTANPSTLPLADRKYSDSCGLSAAQAPVITGAYRLRHQNQPAQTDTNRSGAG